jgi:hypothetical protein
MIAAYLCNEESIAKALDILEGYSHVSMKPSPLFIVLGIYGEKVPIFDGANKLLINLVLISMYAAYVEVNIKTGDGMIRALNSLLRAIDKRSM